MTSLIYIILALILVLILISYRIEGFTCIENVFGKVTCYNSGYYPFFIGDFMYPRYPFEYGKWVHGPSFSRSKDRTFKSY